MIARRKVLSGGALFAGAAALLGRLGSLFPGTARAQSRDPHGQHPAEAAGEGGPRPRPAPAVKPSGLPYAPVVTPDGATLPYVIKDGVKEFHLTAERVRQEFAPGMTVNAWGYNGRTPGPTIEAVEGDRVRILVTNRLPEHTTIHWHGILLPNGMDGVGGLLQPHIKPGETFAYEFTLRQQGTYMYHPHADETIQMAMGMMGFLVIHPRSPRRRIDRDFCLFPHEWMIEPGSSTPNPNIMVDFNIFTFNGRAFPGTSPLLVRLGDRVRLRFANVSMDSHPLHIHGHRMFVVETDGGPIPEPAWWPESTINVPPGTTRTMEFVADNPGDWPLHCHKAHHAMNAMSHDIPNVIGVDQSGLQRKLDEIAPGSMAMGTTGMAEHAMHQHHAGSLPNTLPMMAGTGPHGPIEMGGMFTVIKIRERLASYHEDPGWYDPPAGTLASKVNA
ncbi:MAG TPA: copper oxidase [Vicinamibacteria bacterium]|nr:copper oxidase [Vicinamibacteria bacterium]